MKIFVDANIFIRYLIADDPQKFTACENLFKQARQNKIKLITIPLVITEVIWVLISYYKEKKEDVIQKLRAVALFKPLEIVERDILITSLEYFANHTIDFIDAYIYAWLKKNKITRLYSYDHDFDKLEKAIRKEP